MKRSGIWRSGILAVGLASALGAGALVAGPAHADARDDAQKAISALADQIESGDADGGFRDRGLGDEDGALKSLGDGFSQAYDGGTIYWSADTGARALYGAIDEKYADLGGPDGDTELGFPSESEQDGPLRTSSRVAEFAGEGSPKIIWTPGDGAWLVRGPFSAAADSLGSELGAPTGDMTVDGDVISQSFGAGTLDFDTVTKTWSSTPASLSEDLSEATVPDSPDLGLPGMNLPTANAQDANAATATAADSGSDGISPWWWLLLLLIPLLLLLWWLFSRRRNSGGERTVVHAPRPDDARGLPKVDLSKPAVGAAGAAAAAAAAAKAGGTGARDATDGGAGETDRAADGAGAATAAAAPSAPRGSGDGVGSYQRGGTTVPVPVGGHLPLEDPQAMPAGYPVKGDAETGLYHSPGSASYESTVPQVWFATEAAARAAGFAPADED